MKKIIPNIETDIERRTIDTDELRNMLSCGRQSAVQIGEAAGAKIRIGRRILWDLKKINAYLDNISGGAD